MASNLNEYYNQIGQRLPSVSERANLYSQLGLGGSYSGTASQNAALLRALESQSSNQPSSQSSSQPSLPPAPGPNQDQMTNINETVTRLYNQIFGKAPDQGALDWYRSQMMIGKSEKDIAHDMIQSPEFKDSYSANSILDRVTKQISALIPAAPKPYEQVNPFSFDEALARESATQEYSPYYNQLLSDYMGNVNTQRSRGQADETRLLDELTKNKDIFLSDAERSTAINKETTANQYDQSGLYDSGQQLRATGLVDVNNEANKNKYLTGYGYQTGDVQTKTKNLLEDLTSQANIFQRNNQQDLKTGIEGGVLQRQNEAQQQYEAQRKRYEDQVLNPYNTQKQDLMSAIPSTVASESNRYTDILRQYA